jgi:hypothetical protein
VVPVISRALFLGGGGGFNVSSGEPAQTLAGPIPPMRFETVEGKGRASKRKTKIARERTTIVRVVRREERRLMTLHLPCE